jgi:hypothetical protein
MLVVLAVGCYSKRPAERKVESPTAAGDFALLETLLLPAKPEGAMTIAELKQIAKDGDDVIVQATVPPDKVKPFNDTHAALILMDAADLASENVQNEFACDNADT